MFIFLQLILLIFYDVAAQYENVHYSPDVTNHRNLRLLQDDICGSYSENKIIGGTFSGIYEFPWMAFLGRKLARDESSNTEFFCSGTIINERYILAAAHCIQPLSPHYFISEVRVGEHDTNSPNDCQQFYNPVIRDYVIQCTGGFMTYRVEQIFIHRNYSTDSHINDIALLRLSSNIDFQYRHVKPICLPIGTAAQFLGQKGTACGWGKTKNAPVSTILQKVKIPLVANSQCSRYFSNIFNAYKQICAGGEEDFDTCTGDSGGPFQNIGLYNNMYRMVQYGIISYGPRQCGMNGVPSVYTNIAVYMDWILDHMRD
ncbi:CLIP domain-containing serine protease 2-like [Leptopilina heterotoma]|uniref:CLIP domain-containing serine protease 2-like n=1 Tax=Leptopilina heterotoma TaxID=63436 RepID=UPI001CA9D848|nr:CLIP domain-containing serine protease 2-like [Leptopilina heterotoma]